jgi:hypothetical protein
VASTTFADDLSAASTVAVLAHGGSGRRFQQFRRLGREALRALRGRGAEFPVDLELLASLLRLPPGVGHDRDARFHAWLPRRIGCRSDAAIDDQDMAHARQRFDLFNVCALHLAGKHRSLFNGCVQHSRQFYINAKERLTGNEVVGVDAGLRVADDAVILGSLSLTLLSAGAGSAAALAASSP